MISVNRRIIRLKFHGGTLDGRVPLGVIMETAVHPYTRIQVLGVLASGDYLVRVL